MKRYSALVTCLGESRIIRDVLFANKSAFIRALRAEGYCVNPAKVKESWLFDQIMQQPVYNEESWRTHPIKPRSETEVLP